MIYCPNCSAENAEARKFCRECGSLIVVFCAKCGFANTQQDRFCGGCGTNLSDTTTTKPSESIPLPASSQAYSAYDINELVDDTSQAEEKPKKQKTKPETDKVSQDLIDSIFGPEETDSDKGED
jgi:hypothetical protein